MLSPDSAPRGPAAAEISPAKARWLIRALQILFLLIATAQLNAPLLSAHNERQNQTYDLAQHIFTQGWSAVLTPQTSFSLPGYEAKPFTVIRQEFPFHGLLGWPLVKIFGHQLAILRLLSVAFALASIQLLYLILRTWLAPGQAVAGAALWALSPLVLQFGQVPMPDILCTTGMLAAFWFAQQQKLFASSGCFLFALLAKVSILGFGLPILTALLLAKNSATLKEFSRTAILWGALPLLGLTAWILLELRDHDTPWTILKIASGRSSLNNLLTLKFYFFLLGCLLPYGLGLLGACGCLRATWVPAFHHVKSPLKWTLLGAIIFYLIFVVAKIPEPQYLLPLLAWLVVLAAFGLDTLRPWPRLLPLLLGLQLATSLICTLDLKSSHVPDFDQILRAGQLLPPPARVIAAYPFYGASPAVWLQRNVIGLREVSTLAKQLPDLQKIGFDYVLVLEVKSHTEIFWQNGLGKTIAELFHPSGKPAPANVTTLIAPNSAADFRQFCDARFTKIFSSPAVALYLLNATNQPSP